VLLFLSPDDSAEFNLVNNALLSIFKMDAKGKGSFSKSWLKAVGSQGTWALLRGLFHKSNDLS
jgi:hypothetical protein